MAQHPGECLDVHAILERQGGKCMPQIMKAAVFQSGVLEEPLVDPGHGLWAVHRPGGRGRKQIGIVRMQTVFLDQ